MSGLAGNVYTPVDEILKSYAQGLGWLDHVIYLVLHTRTGVITGKGVNLHLKNTGVT